MNKKVSVVIPAFNEEKYIIVTLTALIAQTYPAELLEIVVVNNNSTDSTAALVLAFVDKHPHCNISLVYEIQPGILHARSAGFAVAKGEYIAQVDADCMPHPSWVSDAVQELENDAVVAVSGPYYYYDAPLFVRLITSFTQRVIFGVCSAIVQKTKRGALMIGGNTMFKKEALVAAGGYNTALAFYSEDTDTAGRLATRGIVRYDTALSMNTSARRFKQQGFFYITWKYFKVFFMIVMGKKVERKDSTEVVHPR